MVAGKKFIRRFGASMWCFDTSCTGVTDSFRQCSQHQGNPWSVCIHTTWFCRLPSVDSWFKLPTLLSSHIGFGMLSIKSDWRSISCFTTCWQAKVVAEAANGPVTPLAETILEANNVVILPDLLLNAVSFKIFFLVGSRCCVMSFCDIPFYCICLGVCKSEILA